MSTILIKLNNLFKEALILFYKINNIDYIEQEPLVVTSTDEKFGDYQCNIAMKLAKILQKNPRQVAQELLEIVQQNDLFDSLILKIEIVGPGFINIFINPDFIVNKINNILLGNIVNNVFNIEHKKEKIIVDFSSPNIAKEMHVGHLRSTIIGDCIARVFEFLGYDVLRLNHLGDWGTSFGMLIYYIKLNYLNLLKNSDISLEDLMQWYRESKKLFDADEQFKINSRAEVVALQAGDKINLEIWKLICQISEKAYSVIYDLLNIKIISRGESFYNTFLKDIVCDLESKKLVQISDQAKCVFLDGFCNKEDQALPVIIQKSDGGYNYATTDIAAIWFRIYKDCADRIIYVTDSGQSLHFKMIFKLAEVAKYLDNKIRVDHVGFGLVLGPDGKKFKTRSGDTEKLIDLINESIDYAKSVIKEKNPNLDKHELEKRAKILGIGAIKYADLSSNRLHDYQFSYEKMMKLEGNTVAFLLYSLVRAKSILSRVQIVGCKNINFVHESEISLCKHISKFDECVLEVADKLFPNRLTDYLYTLAEKFNIFFRDCKVDGSEFEASRALMCKSFVIVMNTGLDLLGIQTLERM